MEIPPNNTLYVNNLNEKIKTEGRLHYVRIIMCFLVIYLLRHSGGLCMVNSCSMFRVLSEFYHERSGFTHLQNDYAYIL